jgi:hypothetical protein
MDELRNRPPNLVGAGASTLRSGFREKVDADISAAFRCLIFALMDYAAGKGWTPRQLDSMHSTLRKKEKELFGRDVKHTKAENLIHWNPAKLITWGRLFGFGEWVQKYIQQPYHKKFRIQKEHFQRMRIVLAELQVICLQDYNTNGNMTAIDNDRSLWSRFIYCICDKVNKSTYGPLTTRTIEGGDHNITTESDIAETEAVCHVGDALTVNERQERLSEKLSKLNNCGDAANLLSNVPHCYEWSVAFREAFSILTPDKRCELGSLLYKTVGIHWQTPDPKSMHVALMAAGTLTYVAGDIEGLKEIKIWSDWLETIIYDLKPEMVLVAEPLSYIASMHGRHGSYLKNIDRMTSDDPLYRQSDFEERLRYCGGRQKSAAAFDTKIANVAKNISDHLHNSRGGLQLLSHDVGRVIEVYPKLIENYDYLDRAQFMKDATLKALAYIDINQSARGRVEDLMEKVRR